MFELYVLELLQYFLPDLILLHLFRDTLFLNRVVILCSFPHLHYFYFLYSVFKVLWAPSHKKNLQLHCIFPLCFFSWWAQSSSHSTLSWLILSYLPSSFLSFSACSLWWAQVDSNHRPHAYQACALTTWAMRPFDYGCPFHPLPVFPTWFPCWWWRWGGSNSWPPACKAGALPAELHPRVCGFQAAACFLFKFLKFLFRLTSSENLQNWTMLTNFPCLT